MPSHEEDSRPLEIILPDIGPYLPEGTNVDDANSLVATYRSHCVQLFDSLKTMKSRKFFDLWTQFQGTLTAPVMKIFTNKSIAAWIEDSDWEMYKVCCNLEISDASIKMLIARSGCLPWSRTWLNAFFHQRSLKAFTKFPMNSRITFEVTLNNCHLTSSRPEFDLLVSSPEL